MLFKGNLHTPVSSERETIFEKFRLLMPKSLNYGI